MIETIDPKVLDKPLVRCAKCDEEVEHYNTFLGPQNDEKNVCWNCLQREEKGFFQKRDFSRRGRQGNIPR